MKKKLTRHLLTQENIDQVIEMTVRFCPCALDGERLLIRGLLILVDDIVREHVWKERRKKTITVERSEN